MTVTIHMPSWSFRSRSLRSDRGKYYLRQKVEVRGPQQGKRATSIERLCYLLFFSLPFITLIQTVLARPHESAAIEQIPMETFISGPQWAYEVPFVVKNKATIEKLIQCESRGMNVSRPDSDGIISDGILQFHRGPGDAMAGGTWEDFSQASGITGSPKDPADAIRMTDWAISHGLGPHWTCWRLQKLSPGS